MATDLMQELMKGIHEAIENIIVVRVEERVAPIRALLGVDPDEPAKRGPKPGRGRALALALLSVPGAKSRRAIARATGVPHATLDKLANAREGKKKLRYYTSPEKARLASLAQKNGAGPTARKEGVPIGNLQRWMAGAGLGQRGGHPEPGPKSAQKKIGRRRWPRDVKLTLAAEAKEQGIPLVAKREGIDPRILQHWVKGERLGQPGRSNG